MSQLTRWVTQKISPSSLKSRASGNELSEKNLNDLDMIKTVLGTQKNADPGHSTREKSSQMSGQTKAIETIQEDLEEAESITNCELHPDIIKEIRLRRSYAAFCEEFTLSGSQQPARRAQLSMGEEGLKEDGQFLAVESVHRSTGMGKGLERPIVIATQPGDEAPRSQTPTTLKSPLTGNTHSVTSSDDLQTTEMAADMQNTEAPISSTSYPRPPPQVLTPSLYHEMQRTRQARRWKFWKPLRSLFSRSQPLRRHRVHRTSLRRGLQ